MKLLKRNLNDLFERARKFFEDIDPAEDILLVHHTDADGYCSGAIFLAALNRLKKCKNIDIVPAANEELEDLLKSPQPKSYKKMIILDIDVFYLKKEFEAFDGQILIIDHHTLREDLNSDKIVYINPRFENEEIYQPVSYVAYNFLSTIADLKDVEWVAVLGTVGDFALEDCRDLLKKWVRAATKKDLVKTDFWKVAKMLYGAIIMKTEDITSLLLKYKTLSELKSDAGFLSAYDKFEKEYEGVRKEFEDHAEHINNIIISVVSPPFKRLGSCLATDLGIENEDKTIIMIEKRGENFKIHARSQSGKVHMGRLMEKCCTLGGGGHRRAAGGSIRASDFEKFRECVISNLK